MRQPYSVNVFLFREVSSGREYLLFKRVARPELALPEFWQGITGAVEAGESLSDAALREVLEETGIRLSSLASSGFTHRYPIKAEWRTSYGLGPTVIEEHVYYACVTPEANPTISHEHKEWQWYKYPEACRLLNFGENLKCLESVEQKLTNA